MLPRNFPGFAATNSRYAGSKRNCTGEAWSGSREVTLRTTSKRVPSLTCCGPSQSNCAGRAGAAVADAACPPPAAAAGSSRVAALATGSEESTGMRSSLASGRYVRVTWVSPMDSTRYAPSSVSPSLIGHTMSPLARSTDCRPPCTSFPAYLYGIGGAVGAGGTWGAVEILGAGGCHEREEKSCERSSPSRERSGSARGTEPPPPAACDELPVLAVRGERSTLPESRTTNPSVPARTASRPIFLIRARMSLKHFIEPAKGYARCYQAGSL